MTWSAGVRALGVAVVLTALAAACGNAASKGDSSASNTTRVTGTSVKNDDFTKNVPVKASGVTDTAINVGSIVSKTNPLGTDVGIFNDGIEGYFDLVNSRGGIYGRKLTLKSKRDDQTFNNSTQVEAMLTQDNVYAAFIATELFTGARALETAGIPTFGWNINAEWAGPQNLFPNAAPQCFEGCPLLPHVTPWLAQQVKAKRVAVLGYSVPQAASCVNGSVDNFKKFGTDVGAEVVYSDSSLSFGQTDFSPQVSKMKSAKADFLVTCMDFNGDHSVAKEMGLQGIRDGVTFYHANLYNPEFVKTNAEALEGGIVGTLTTASEHRPPAPGVQEYLDYAKAHGLTVTEMTMQGWIAARQFVDALKSAGPNFTRANLIAAWNQQTAYTAGGWIIPVDWTKQHHDPADGVQYRSQFECETFVKIEKGAFVPIYDGGGGKPWVCFDGHKPDVWAEPVNLSFADAAKLPATYAEAKQQAAG